VTGAIVGARSALQIEELVKAAEVSVGHEFEVAGC
jgi:hypothetical protein